MKNIEIEFENLKENSMLLAKPSLIEEWDFDKNKEIDITKVTRGTHAKVWWIDAKCKHSYETNISSKVKGTACPYCKNKKVLKGFNDINTTNPKLASFIKNEEDKYKYTQFSHKLVEFICPNCKNDCGKKKISDINIYGLSCEKCRNNISYPEKFMRELLIISGLDFKYDCKFEWSDNRRYDFYIESHNLIIEMHGKQHYEGGFETTGGKSLDEEIKNDDYKLNLALDNGITNYVIIDSKISDSLYLKKNIINSKLSNFIELSNLNWELINEKSQNSISLDCLNLWNSGIRDIKLISENLKIHVEMTRRYLKQWSNFSQCDFNKTDNRKSKIKQSTINDEFIKYWESVDDILKCNSDMTRLELNKVFNNINDSAYGFKWEYVKESKSKGSKSKAVVKLNDNLELLTFYKSLSSACAENNIKSMGSLSQCCKGMKRKYVQGYRWMYADEYVENILKVVSPI